MKSNLISLFNNHYQQYLNNFDKDIIIKSFIKKYFILINQSNIKYTLLENNSINLVQYYPYSFNTKLIFDNQIIGYLSLNKEIIHDTYDLFINYLSMFIYNFKFNNLVENMNHSIFMEIIDMVNDGLIVCDSNYIIHTINTTAKNMINTLNIYNTNYLNIKLFDVFSQLEDILKQNEIYKNKKIYYKIDKNNNNINFLLLLNTIIYNNIYYYVIIINHVTDKNNRNNDGFLSHELRNPLQTINFANHLIQKKNLLDITHNHIENNNEHILSSDLKKYLNIIDKSVYDMIKIINDILDIDRLDSNKLDLKFDLINIYDLIEEIKFNFTHHITDNNIKFDVIINENLESINYNFYTDITRIKQILLNILDNSVKYSKPSSLNNIILNISYDNNSNYINFSISDTGIGINHINDTKSTDFIGWDHKNIAFNNLNKPNKAECKSNGLGLYVCNKLAKLLGGIIKINRAYTTGTEFIFCHPVKINNNIINKNIENFNINAKILLVDDNENIILLFKDILENIKYKNNNNNNNLLIDCCDLNELIIDLVKVNNYDIIFLDINGEHINGMTLARVIRRNGFNNKIIPMIYNLDESLDKSLFDGILIKPFGEQDIIDKLKLIN
jgi:signal transduction histidine kinase/CheY-like chemotaxis protein